MYEFYYRYAEQNLFSRGGQLIMHGTIDECANAFPNIVIKCYGE